MCHFIEKRCTMYVCTLTSKIRCICTRFLTLTSFSVLHFPENVTFMEIKLLSYHIVALASNRWHYAGEGCDLMTLTHSLSMTSVITNDRLISATKVAVFGSERVNVKIHVCFLPEYTFLKFLKSTRHREFGEFQT